MIRRPPRSTQSRSSAASDVYKRQRRISAHVAALDANAELFARQVSFVETAELQLVATPDAADFLEARKNGFEFLVKEGNTYALSRRVVGSTVVTNFDTAI